jgi:hypothetical protein
MVVMAPDDCFVENEREQQQQKITFHINANTAVKSDV